MVNIWLRSPRVASRAFDISGKTIPRVKFNFFVEFILSSDAKSMVPQDLASIGNTGLSFKVKTVDKPKINLMAEELNQYNKKVIAYKRVDYGDATLHIYDDVSDSMLSFWQNYFRYYFADSRAKQSDADGPLGPAYSQSPVDAQFNDGSGWGFRPLTNTTSFFERIRVNALYGGTVTSFSYVNPKITSIDWQGKDYSSSDPEEVNVTFKYEAIIYEKNGSKGDMTKFGWSNTEVKSLELGNKEGDFVDRAPNGAVFNPSSIQPYSPPNSLATSASPSLAGQLRNLQAPTLAGQSISRAPGASVPPPMLYSARTQAGTPNFGDPAGPQTVSVATTISNEPFVPGRPLTDSQMASIGIGRSLGLDYPASIMAQYNKQNGMASP